MNYDKIGKFIKELRIQKNLTQKDLASRLNVTDKAISKWERGMGCPDVSLLEELSNILDVSILEILKGRKINNEEFQNDHLNNYVLDTINYSKNELHKKTKNIILNIFSFIIIFISITILILNIYHINYLNKEYKYNFNSEEIKNININLAKIENNINKFKNSELIYTKKENGQLLDIINSMYIELKNHPILEYNGEEDLTINDLYLIDNYEVSGIYLAYNILGKYNYKLLDYIEHKKTFLILKEYSFINLKTEIDESYKYNINDNGIDNYKVSARVYELLYNIEELLLLTNNILEIGGFYE